MSGRQEGAWTVPSLGCLKGCHKIRLRLAMALNARQEEEHGCGMGRAGAEGSPHPALA